MDENSPEVTTLRGSLVKAKRNAQDSPIAVQVEGAQEFVDELRSDRKLTTSCAESWRSIVRILNSRYGLRSVRVGASNPGPGSKRRRSLRVRVLQWSMDSDSESSSDEQPLMQSTSVPPDVLSALEHDLCGSRSPLTAAPRDPKASGRVCDVNAEVLDEHDMHRVPAKQVEVTGDPLFEISGQEVAEVHFIHCRRILGRSRSHSGVRSHTVGFI